MCASSTLDFGGRSTTARAPFTRAVRRPLSRARPQTLHEQHQDADCVNCDEHGLFPFPLCRPKREVRLPAEFVQLPFMLGFFFLTIHNDCLCCVGFLPAEHSTKDPVPAVHQEPAVLHSAHQSEPMPILSTEEVHRRRNEPRRSVSLIVFFFLILRKIRAVKGYSPTAASSRRSLMTPLYGALTSLESELCAETRL